MSDSSAYEEANRQPSVPPPFHKRFDIQVDLKDAKQRFVNRVLNEIDSKLNGLARHHDYPYRYKQEMEYVASMLGVEASGASALVHYSGKDFDRLLLCVEALYEALDEYKSFGSPWERRNLDDIVKWALSISEVDLGIQWMDGHFRPSGAKLLDEELVTEPLRWLAGPKYNTVLEPFQKGLRHYMQANKEPSKLSDAITDMYEALEALAKAVTGRNRDLSANRELFIGKLDLSQYYSKMLDDYKGYANEFRHGTEPGKVRIKPKPNEVEAFIYTTGLFIRLAIRQLAER